MSYAHQANGDWYIGALPVAFANVSGFHKLPDATLATYGWYPFQDTTPPALGAYQVAVPGAELQGSTVVRTWTVRAMTADEAKAADIAALRDQTKADAFVQAFTAMSFAEVGAYVDANVTDLASAKLLLKRLSQMVLYLVKRAY